MLTYSDIAAVWSLTVFGCSQIFRRHRLSVSFRNQMHAARNTQLLLSTARQLRSVRPTPRRPDSVTTGRVDYWLLASVEISNLPGRQNVIDRTAPDTVRFSVTSKSNIIRTGRDFGIVLIKFFLVDSITVRYNTFSNSKRSDWCWP